MLERDVAREIRERRRNEYKYWNRRVKEWVKERKMRVNGEFGRKHSEKSIEDKLFLKEVNRK